ncbi:hypothetical protein WICPIJ_008035 [Wickerhamomyces pijperi]|uniref:Amino acid permease/ SLC12A domain-containing protein n=1 Tax=Wickerhamomyces pijperi TaxID=599730 RepID=A0A9P8Q0M0_WICPI|nr:hypothetical protein WICPIJ_008035 [Wickerhamomyces pijperi]
MSTPSSTADIFAQDIEKDAAISANEETDSSLKHVSSVSETVQRGDIDSEKPADVPVVTRRWFNREWSSFQRQTKEDVPDAKAKVSTFDTLIISLATGLGTGLLVGSGKGLSNAGPLGSIIAMVVASIAVVLTIYGAGELSVTYSGMSGGFNAQTIMLVDPSFGFAVAWGYAINWFTVLPLEMVTASMTIKYWTKSTNSDIFVCVFLAVVYFVNFTFGPKGYSSFEKICGIVKLTMIAIFITSGIFFICGVNPNHIHFGDKYYSDPGMFANGFKGVCLCFVTFAFSLGGTEFIALTAPDQNEPKKAIPRAVKLVVVRVILFYLGSIIIMGFLVPHNSKDLMGANSEKNAAPVSPFVLACVYAGVPGLGHFINAVICIAVISVANSALYSSSNTFQALAEQGLNFKWFDFKDKKGRPLRAMLVSAVIGLFSFIAAYEDQESIFVWLLSLSGLATIFTWMSINISHIRFIRACKAQQLDRSELRYTSPIGEIGSWVALTLNIFFLAVHFWVSLWPLNNDGKPDAKNFFQNYLGFFTTLMLFIGHKIYLFIKGHKVNWFFHPSESVDLHTHIVY